MSHVSDGILHHQHLKNPNNIDNSLSLPPLNTLSLPPTLSPKSAVHLRTQSRMRLVLQRRVSPSGNLTHAAYFSGSPPPPVWCFPSFVSSSSPPQHLRPMIVCHIDPKYRCCEQHSSTSEPGPGHTKVKF